MTNASSEKNADGKSFVNPPTGKRSTAYERFVDPIDNGERGGFDIHIYFYQENAGQKQYAQELWERIRRECMSQLFSILPEPCRIAMCASGTLR